MSDSIKEALESFASMAEQGVVQFYPENNTYRWHKLMNEAAMEKAKAGLEAYVAAKQSSAEEVTGRAASRKSESTAGAASPVTHQPDEATCENAQVSRLREILEELRDDNSIDPLDSYMAEICALFRPVSKMQRDLHAAEDYIKRLEEKVINLSGIPKRSTKRESGDVRLTAIDEVATKYHGAMAKFYEGEARKEKLPGIAEDFMEIATRHRTYEREIKAEVWEVWEKLEGKAG